MATKIGETTADGVNVNVSEYAGLTRIYQDTDVVLLVSTRSIDVLIEKLQVAKTMITEAQKEDKQHDRVENNLDNAD